MCRGVRLERHIERLGEIPCHRQLAIPKEILAHRYRQFHIHIGLVAGLLLIVGAVDIGNEAQLLREPIKLPFAQEFHIFTLTLGVKALERTERLERGSIIVLETAAIVVGVLIFVVGVFVVALVRRVVKHEVGGIPWHGEFALHIEAQA